MSLRLMWKLTQLVEVSLGEMFLLVGEKENDFTFCRAKCGEFEVLEFSNLFLVYFFHLYFWVNS